MMEAAQYTFRIRFRKQRSIITFCNEKFLRFLFGYQEGFPSMMRSEAFQLIIISQKLCDLLSIISSSSTQNGQA